jgi:hypothetical protein
MAVEGEKHQKDALTNYRRRQFVRGMPPDRGSNHQFFFVAV